MLIPGGYFWGVIIILLVIYAVEITKRWIESDNTKSELLAEVKKLKNELFLTKNKG